MGAWVETVERKAQILHEQLSAAKDLAQKNGGDVDEISQLYLRLLSELYQNEFAFAQLADSSDLVARFAGPAVSDTDPTVTIVTSVFSDLRNQIRGIAKSIVGLSNETRLKWPSELDPHLSGLAQGSLVVGISIPPPDEAKTTDQLDLPGVSEQVHESVRSAVRSLATVARYIGEKEISDEIAERFPDPAVRDTVMVAASKLAPSGRKGIDSLSLYGAEDDSFSEAVLTPQSRRILNSALSQPVRVTGTGNFKGVVREIDLDAKRFEIRRMQNAGTLRCVYGSDQQDLVRSILDAEVEIRGDYETLMDQRPRLINVSEIEIVRPASQQLDIDLDEE